MKLSEIINLLPTVRHQRERIAELEAELAALKADPRLAWRSPEEVEDACRMLHSILSGELDKIEIEHNGQIVLQITSDTICWVLQHPHHNSTEAVLAMIRAALLHAGYKPIDIDNVDISTLTNIISTANGGGGKDDAKR